jgi:hypothetical protein
MIVQYLLAAIHALIAEQGLQRDDTALENRLITNNP